MEQHRLYWLLGIVGVFLFAPLSASANDEQGDSEGYGHVLFTSQTETVQAPLLSSEVDIQVTGMVARVAVQQTFSNPNQDWVNATYHFPLPPDAAVDKLIMQAGERRIEGEIRTKQVARAQFQQAKKNGQQASLVRQVKANYFVSELANLAPGQSLSVTIEYQQVVPFRDGRYRLRFPIATTPRAGADEPLTTDASAFSHKAVDLKLSVQLQPGFQLAGLSSPYHQISAKRTAQAGYRVDLSPQDVSARDFVLQWWPKYTAQPQSYVVSDGEFGLLMVIPPTMADDGFLPRTQHFMLDVSGSMQGESIRQAKAAVIYALHHLHSTDYFNLSVFNHDVGSLFSEPVPASQDNLELAQQWLRDIDADGGTDIDRALRHLLHSADMTQVTQQWIFVTDGSVNNEEALMQLLVDELGDNRLFTVGIGAAPNSLFMQQAALEGRGTYTYIGDVNEVGNKMSALLDKLNNLVLTDVGTDAEGYIQSFPRRVPDVYANEPLVLSFRLNQPIPINFNVSGHWQGEPWQQQVEMVAVSSQQGLDKLWGRKKIAQLTRDRRLTQADKQDIDQQITHTALSFGLVSEFTSLIAIDKTPQYANPSMATDTHVSRPLPATYQHGVLPRGATGWKGSLLLGLSLLVISGLLWRRYE